MANYKQISAKHPLAPCLFLKFAAFILCFASRDGVLATQYTVGGASGWNLGADYKSWASQNSFKTGDSLLFTYGSLHSVLQVSEADYNACNTANAISTRTGGNTIVKLDKAQTYYFICGTPGHCGSGMQLSVKVDAATSSSSSSTPSTTPSTSTTPSSSTPTTTTSPSMDTSFTPPLPLHNLPLLSIITTLVIATSSMLT